MPKSFCKDAQHMGTKHKPRKENRTPCCRCLPRPAESRPGSTSARTPPVCVPSASKLRSPGNAGLATRLIGPCIRRKHSIVKDRGSKDSYICKDMDWKKTTSGYQGYGWNTAQTARIPKNQYFDPDEKENRKEAMVRIGSITVNV